MLFVKAMLRRSLPLSFCSYVSPLAPTFNGIKHLFVLVHYKLFKKLQELPPKGCNYFDNLWDYYFVGFGIVRTNTWNRKVEPYDWTFQGDDINRPIPDLRGLDNV